MKEKYIKIRNSQKLDNNFLWEYYKSEGGKLNNPEEFLDLFYYETTDVVINGRNFGQQKTNRDLSHFFEDMDRKFGLQTLWGKNGDFIKVVE